MFRAVTRNLTFLRRQPTPTLKNFVNRMATKIEVLSGCDLHVHLRQGKLMNLVTPLITEGGPNLTPPIKTTEEALRYKEELVKLNPTVNYLMSLYLSPELTPEEIYKASKAGVAGVKSYPRGVTTNSDSGIESYEAYYPIFEAMQQVDMVLNLHGEVPSDANNNICVLNAEEKFLTHLESLHAKFPKLRIVLEHATTAAAVNCVKKLGPTVGCTITLHHLQLTVDDWAGSSHHFCKPVAKYPDDRKALQEVVKSGNPKFFLGSDSAPHPSHKKIGGLGCAAGIFTTPYLMQYLATLLESWDALNQLQTFATTNGAKFYKLDANDFKKVTLYKENWVVPSKLNYLNEEDFEADVVPFLAGKELAWKLVK